MRVVEPGQVARAPTPINGAVSEILALSEHHCQSPVQVDWIKVDQLAAAVGVVDFVRILDGKDGVISGRGDVKDLLLRIVGPGRSGRPRRWPGRDDGYSHRRSPQHF